MKGLYTGDGKFIVKSGHTDAASAITSCKIIMSHCQMILDGLEGNEGMDKLPTWWTVSQGVGGRPTNVRTIAKRGRKRTKR
jgi:hypothetical protein